MCLSRKRNPGGFTLTEMLVVLGIIVMLMAIMVPAIQGARASARKAQCQNNLKNYALAALEFETVNEKFPSYNHELNGNNVGVAVMLTPYLEEMKLWEAWDSGQVAQKYWPILICPSDAPENPEGTPNSYVTNLDIFQADAASCKSVFWINENDGTGHTLLVSEKRGCEADARSWAKVDQVASDVAFTYGENPPGTPIKMRDQLNSHHGNGVSVVYCDGHAQFLSVELPNYNALCNPSDGAW